MQYPPGRGNILIIFPGAPLKLLGHQSLPDRKECSGHNLRRETLHIKKGSS
jgi:hypothetical protein